MTIITEVATERGYNNSITDENNNIVTPAHEYDTPQILQTVNGDIVQQNHLQDMLARQTQAHMSGFFKSNIMHSEVNYSTRASRSYQTQGISATRQYSAISSSVDMNVTTDDKSIISTRNPAITCGTSSNTRSSHTGYTKEDLKQQLEKVTSTLQKMDGQILNITRRLESINRI